MKIKKCNKCKKIKLIDEFSWRNKTKNWRQGTCKKCFKEIQKDYYKENKEEIKKCQKKYYKNNKEHHNKQTQKWWIENGGKEYYNKRKEYFKEYQLKNKEKIKKCIKNYRLKNKEYFEIYSKEYYKNNKRYYKEYNKNWWKSFIPTLKYRLNSALSSNIRHSIKQHKNRKHWEDLVNWSLSELKKHLESQFQLGMTWENYGKWHIDHIIPISLWKFKKSTDREFKQCWALCNLQPLWAKDNLSKGNKCV